MHLKIPTIQGSHLKPVHDSEFQLIRRMIYQKTGIFLNDHKKTMLANRLRNRLNILGFESYKRYYDYITKEPAGRNELSECIDCLTTNETFFFRHVEQIEYLVDHIVPELRIRNKSDHVKIWSIGCSSGEEPYSIAMLLEKKLKPKEWDRIEIIASDISRSMIERAQQGIYTDCAFRQMTEADKSKYFTAEKNTGAYRISPKIQNRVHFFTHNLLHTFHCGPFDVIVCRNVLIYFNSESKEKALSKMLNYLRPSGYLIIGFAESLIGQKSQFTYVRPTVYRRREE